MLIKHAQKEALKQINTTFKLSEIGYGQGFHEGQMQERKYWKDEIKAKIEELEKELEDIELKNINKDEISKTTFYFIDRLKCKIEVLQSLLEKE